MTAVRWTFAVPRAWIVAAVGLLGYAGLYLLVAKAIVFEPAAGFSRFGTLPLLIVAPDLSLGHIARWLDPVFVLYLTDALVISPSAPVLLTAALLGGLIGMNAAVSVEAAVRPPAACERRAWWAAGVLPSFLASFSCCAPTILLLVGGTFAGAVIAIVPFVVPVAAALLLASLAYSLRRIERTTLLEAAPAAV
ncbi:MAG: hypothetical protein ACRDGT_01220 [Candidatus Limnocylindria bacterium]